MFTLAFLLTVVAPIPDDASRATASPTPKIALQQLQRLVGSWKGTGYPEGSREERQKGYWVETITWGWKFDKAESWLEVQFDKGKHFQRGELRYLTKTKQYQLKLTATDKSTLIYTGLITQESDGVPTLSVERPLGEGTERLVFSLLHDNRHLYKLEQSSRQGARFVRQYQVGATKLGESFASVPKGVECIVSGGKASISVMHKGKEYFVCCGGCKDAFYEEPEKYIAEYEAKKK